MKKENFAIFPTLVSAFDFSGHSQEQVCLDIINDYDNMTDHALIKGGKSSFCLLYTSPSPRDRTRSRMPSSA